MKRYAMAGALAVMFAGATAAAQTGTAQQPPATQQQPSATAQAGTTTLTGCVYKERDIPGRTPNVAEQAGVLEDYILADVKPAASAGAASGMAGATGTAGASSPTMHKMFKLEKIADEKLSAMVGKRVEVTGRIDAEAGDSTARPATGATQPADKSAGPDQIELAEFEVDSIREVEGTCPAKPSGRN